MSSRLCYSPFMHALHAGAMRGLLPQDPLILRSETEVLKLSSSTTYHRSSLASSILVSMPTDRSQQNLDSNSPGSAAQAAPTTASSAPSHADASALQSEQQGTGHQTVADKLRPDSHASKAQVGMHTTQPGGSPPFAPYVHFSP